MLRINCSACHQTLTEPGGLLFGPPDEEDQSHKQHLCQRCYRLFRDLVSGYTVTAALLLNRNDKPQSVMLRRQQAGEALARCPIGWKRQPISVQL